MTHFDHFFILYTGVIIGIICFVFPLIISVYQLIEKKRLAIEEEADAKSDNAINESLARMNNPQNKPDIKKEFITVGKVLTWEDRKKSFNHYFYSPQVRFWLILIPLFASLVMCILDIYLSQNFKLTYWSLIPFFVAVCFLVETLKVTVKIIKESL